MAWRSRSGTDGEGTRMTNHGPMGTKQEAAAAVRAAKVQLGLTWAQIAEAVGRPVAWTTTALLGQHPMSEPEAAAAADLRELDSGTEVALRLETYRGAVGTPVPSDTP